MKIFAYFVVAGFAGLLVYASLWLPALGTAEAPLHRDFSAGGSRVAGGYYIRNAYADANTPNIVTVVLADYRGFDTLGETLVVLTAGIACSLILRRKTSE